MLILAIILFGMLVGAAAQLILRRPNKGIDWARAFAAGLLGAVVGGVLGLLLDGGPFDLINWRPSALVGSVIGAVIVTAVWGWWETRSRKTS